MGDRTNPTVCRMVHYVSHGTPPKTDGSQTFPSECRAATVVERDKGAGPTLFVMNPSGLFFNQAQMDSTESPAGGSWHWPQECPYGG